MDNNCWLIVVSQIDVHIPALGWCIFITSVHKFSIYLNIDAL